MKIELFIKELQSKSAELDRLARRTLPVKIGTVAKRHFQENFEKGGFVNNGLKPWAKAIRQQGTSTDARYKTLMSRRNALYKAIQSKNSNYRTKVYNDTPYAEIHNEGGDIIVTAKMKRFFWAKHIALKKTLKTTKSGKQSQSRANQQNQREANVYKAMALKKVGSKIRIPQRKFLGESLELNNAITGIVQTEISNILNK